MARSILKRILIFVVVYIAMSSIIAYVFREDQNFLSMEDTIEYQGKEVSIKVLYNEGEELWAQDTLELASGSVEKLIEGFSTNSPHELISIYSTTSEQIDGYPFKLERDASNVSVPTDLEINTAVWGMSQMWILKDFIELPDWVLWGHSSYLAYWAMNESGFSQEAEEMKDYFSSGVSEYDGEMKLASYDMPDNLKDEPIETNYFLGRSFQTYDELYSLTTVETMADIYKGMMSSQNYIWDSSRYVSYVQDNTEADVSSVFAPIFEGDVSSEIFKWKTLYYLELVMTGVLCVLIFVYAFWDNVKERVSSFVFFKERTRAGRELIKKYGSKDVILMELESYFKRHIPDDEYEKYLKIYFKEMMLKNKT